MRGRNGSSAANCANASAEGWTAAWLCAAARGEQPVMDSFHWTIFDGCVCNSCTSDRLPDWFVDFVKSATHQDKDDVALGTFQLDSVCARANEWNATGGGLSIEFDEDDPSESTQQQLHVRGQGRQIRVGGAPPPRQQARPQGGIQAQAAVGQSRPASPDRGRPQGGW